MTRKISKAEQQRIEHSVQLEKATTAGKIMKKRNEDGGVYSKTVAKKKLKKAEKDGIWNADASEGAKKAYKKAKGKK